MARKIAISFAPNAFLGRLAEQVKIRGFRIEPAEIVAARDLVPGGRASAVVARTRGDEPELVAYVIAADQVPPTAPTSSASWSGPRPRRTRRRP